MCRPCRSSRSCRTGRSALENLSVIPRPAGVLVVRRGGQRVFELTVIRDSFSADRLRIPYSKDNPVQGRRRFAKSKKGLAELIAVLAVWGHRRQSKYYYLRTL